MVNEILSKDRNQFQHIYVNKELFLLCKFLFNLSSPSYSRLFNIIKGNTDSTLTFKICEATLIISLVYAHTGSTYKRLSLSLV